MCEPMKTEKFYVVIMISGIMVMLSACTLHEKMPIVNSATEGGTDCVQSIERHSVLLAHVGPLEFKSVDVISAIDILYHKFTENHIYQSIIVVDMKNSDAPNTMINLTIEEGELRNVLDKFCRAWGGTWELIGDKGPIVFRKERAE